MKTRSLLTLFGLAICFALPIFAQQKDTPEPRISQQRDLLGIPDALADFGELSGKLDDAYNKNDAEAAAALFTEDGVLVTPDGMVFGRQAIEKWYADTFQRWPVTDFLSRRDRFRLNAIDNAVWSAGEWWGTLQGQTGPVFAWGYWSTIYVREGDTWKMRMLSLFDHRPLSPSSQSTIDPEVRQKIETVLTKFGEAFNKRDAAAMADLYTQEAVQVWTWVPTDEAVASGRQAIEKRYKVMLSSSPGTFTGEIVDAYAIGNDISVVTKDVEGTMWKGYKVWICVPDADTWKIRMEYVN